MSRRSRQGNRTLVVGRERLEKIQAGVAAVQKNDRISNFALGERALSEECILLRIVHNDYGQHVLN